MSKILLYLDEDAMDEDFVRELRSRNVDVVTVADVGMLNRSDEGQLTWASDNGRVIFSFNARDFYQLHSVWIEQERSHAGIVLAPQQWYGIGDLRWGILKLINSKSAIEMWGKIEFLSHWI